MSRTDETAQIEQNQLNVRSVGLVVQSIRLVAEFGEHQTTGAGAIVLSEENERKAIRDVRHEHWEQTGYIPPLAGGQDRKKSADLPDQSAKVGLEEYYDKRWEVFIDSMQTTLEKLQAEGRWPKDEKEQKKLLGRIVREQAERLGMKRIAEGVQDED